MNAVDSTVTFPCKLFYSELESECVEDDMPMKNYKLKSIAVNDIDELETVVRETEAISGFQRWVGNNHMKSIKELISIRTKLRTI